MGRVLAIARATVPSEHEAEYIRTIHALAHLGAGKGEHLWLFRGRERPGSFIEFSESTTQDSHRGRAARTDGEALLETRLGEIARYAPGSQELWEEVPAPKHDGAEGAGSS